MSRVALNRDADGAYVAALDAPAKINLTLAVGPRRDDGYHPLVSVLHAIDLCDRLTVRLTPAEPDNPRAPFEAVVVVVDAPSLEGGDTLVTRAVEAFCTAAGLRLHVQVHLDKQIPPGAGLGGGSSDAAAALLALNELLDQPLTEARLAEVAAGIGSDVPFFLGTTGTAVVTGRGEIVEAVDALEPRSWLVAWPGVVQPTARVYSKYLPRRESLPTIETALEDARAGRYYNDLTHMACTICGPLNVLDALMRWAGGTPFVAGSGSALFVQLEEGLDAKRFLDAAQSHPGTVAWLARSWIS